MTHTQLSQNRANPNFDEHEQTSHIHFFDILEVPKSILKNILSVDLLDNWGQSCIHAFFKQ